MATKNITIRMDDELKKQFSYLCYEIGLSMGSAFTLFAKTVVRERCIPFELKASIPNKETLEAMLEAERISRDPNAKTYSSVTELFEDLNSDESIARTAKF